MFHQVSDEHFLALFAGSFFLVKGGLHRFYTSRSVVRSCGVDFSYEYKFEYGLLWLQKELHKII